jgi:hypothetical protein
VRVGAVNRRFARSDWATLAWGLKVELLPLLGQQQEFELLERGVAEARRPGMTVRTLRLWVLERRSEVSEKSPAASKPTLRKAGRAFELTAALRRSNTRRMLLDGVRALDDESRTAFRAALADALRNLTRLQRELIGTPD